MYAVIATGGKQYRVSEGTVVRVEKLDADAGANLQQNHPVLDPAFSGGSSVSGTLDSVADALFVVDVFATAACDPSGHGEGAELLASLAVATDATGHADFVTSLARSVDTASEVLSAIATDAAGNTSEFSPCAPVPAPPTTVTRPFASSTTTFTARARSSAVIVTASPVVPMGTSTLVPPSICWRTSAR